MSLDEDYNLDEELVSSGWESKGEQTPGRASKTKQIGATNVCGEFDSPFKCTLRKIKESHPWSATWRTSIASIAAFLTHTLSFHLSFYLLGLLALLLSVIPVINILYALLIKRRKEAPEVSSMFISTVVSYKLTKFVADKITEPVGTYWLSCIIGGTCVVILNAFTTYSVLYFDGFKISITLALGVVPMISGICLIMHGVMARQK